MGTMRLGDRVLDPSTLRMTPRLNEPAPDFDARTTHGPRKLADYHGKWLLLFSHPADFTPVCTSEFVAFAKAAGEFAKLNCELLGLSIDSNYSHLAWIRNIKEKFGVDVPFPIIEDVSMWVSSVYGMIQPGASETTTVRATFLIDPEGVLRAMTYYPIGVGRSIAEFLRMLTAVQTCDKHGVATPEGWQPGDKVILRPPRTVDEIGQHTGDGAECIDWYYCQKPLDQ